MDVYVYPHGKHSKRGDTAQDYDGNLTAEGLAQVRETQHNVLAILIEEKPLIFSGIQLRHMETAEELGLDTKQYQRVLSCGDDEAMFALIESGDERVMSEWLAFLDEQKAKGVEAIMVITSRLYPMMMTYCQLGGRAKFGNLREFCNACETLMGLDLAVIPQFGQAVLTRWKY